MDWLIATCGALLVSQGALIWWVFQLEFRLRRLESRGLTVR
jgi:hypothetical protein